MVNIKLVLLLLVRLLTRQKHKTALPLPYPIHESTDQRPAVKQKKPQQKQKRSVKGLAMIIIRRNLNQLFNLGTVVATPGAVSLLDELDVRPDELLSRHQTGDWGDLDEHDRGVNFHAVENGFRIMSAYCVGDKSEVIWVITEADRSVTTLLLPAEY